MRAGGVLRRRECRGSAKIWLPITGLVLIVLILAYSSARPKGSDEDQIRGALAASIKASEKGEAGGVLDKLSDAFAVNAQTVGKNQVADAIRRFKPKVKVTQPSPTVENDTAHIDSPVDLSVSLLGMERTITIPNVDFEFKREDAHVWLIFPVHAWHLSRIQVPPDVMNQVQGFAD